MKLVHLLGLLVCFVLRRGEARLEICNLLLSRSQVTLAFLQFLLCLESKLFGLRKLLLQILYLRCLFLLKILHLLADFLHFSRRLFLLDRAQTLALVLQVSVSFLELLNLFL